MPGKKNLHPSVLGSHSAKVNRTGNDAMVDLILVSVSVFGRNTSKLSNTFKVSNTFLALYSLFIYTLTGATVEPVQKKKSYDVNKLTWQDEVLTERIRLVTDNGRIF